MLYVPRLEERDKKGGRKKNVLKFLSISYALDLGTPRFCHVEDSPVQWTRDSMFYGTEYGIRSTGYGIFGVLFMNSSKLNTRNSVMGLSRAIQWSAP